ncbi:hypothetical protein TNCV_235271 [Trichonephila clavipes]|uniref:Uncharacterized protein n=1 Tax=Trichonephila clavipes TaxID=2585209 RepID=A0A8X6VE11_TRICX|nr:hypothetical protein TNCV_235271 [Trichonephila clavipes]
MGLSEKHHMGIKDIIPMELGIDITDNKNVQLCRSAQNYVTSDKDSFATKSVKFCYVGGMNALQLQFPSQLKYLTEKQLFSFLQRLGLMF